MSHLEILDMIARGMFGCPRRLPIDLDNWTQVRPAMWAAHDEIVSLRRQLTAANAEIERLKAERDGFFEYGIAVAKERDQLRAERDALGRRLHCDGSGGVED